MYFCTNGLMGDFLIFIFVQGMIIDHTKDIIFNKFSKTYQIGSLLETCSSLTDIGLLLGCLRWPNPFR